MLLTQTYVSDKTKTKILSNKEIKNKDLINLAESNFVEGDIVSYDEDSFVFKTPDIILPTFLSGNLGFGKTVIGIPVNNSKITRGFKLELSNYISELLGSEETMIAMRQSLDVDHIINNFKQAAQDNLADIIDSMSQQAFLKTIKVNFDFCVDEDNDSFIITSVSLPEKVNDVLSEYTEAIMHLNKLYKSSMIADNLYFAPIQTKMGEQLLSIVRFINGLAKSIRHYLTQKLLAYVESTLACDISAYIVEENEISGIKEENNCITYFKNSCFISRNAVIFRDTEMDNIVIGYLRKDKPHISVLPTSFSLRENRDLFSEVIELSYVNYITIN